jgi:hypothetical protein
MEKKKNTGMSIVFPLEQPIPVCLDCRRYQCPIQRQIEAKKTGRCDRFFGEGRPQGMTDQQLTDFFIQRKKNS